MIRYLVIPHNVREFFEKDKYLGNPMIAKCCEEGTIPKWFDEEEARQIFGWSYEERSEDGDKLVKRVIESLTPKWREIGETKFEMSDLRHERYLSFHPWHFYKEVIGVGEASIIMAIGNFDRALSMLDRGSNLQKRDLPREGAHEYRIALPPMQ